MATKKTFNIDKFVQDATEGVEVAEIQKKKEQQEQEIKTAETITVQAPIPSTEQNIQNSQPLQENTDKTAVAGKRGRPKSYRTIERVNGKIVYLEKETDGELARISILERFDKQDIIRTALHEWLNKHYNGTMLDQEGRSQIIEYIERTTSFEGF